MSEIIIIKMVFEIMLSIGTLILLVIAFKLYYKYLVQEKRCIKKAKGIIKKYTISSRGGENSGVHLPVVFYEVDGKEYKIVGPEYKSYKTISITTPLSENKIIDFYEDENQKLVIKRQTNAFIGVYKNPIQEMYPLNSEIDVFYDETNPKLAYVLRYCNRKSLFWLMFISAMFTLIIDLCILFIL